jgi:hypothetical protein
MFVEKRLKAPKTAKSPHISKIKYAIKKRSVNSGLLKCRNECNES